jgi:flagellar biosynthesis protein FlhG
MGGWTGQGRQVDQAEHLRQRMAVVAPDLDGAGATFVLAVTSGKGGVGKTLVAANLSIALAARGHRVALFDMDMGLANADIVLGVEAVYTWRDLLTGSRAVDEVMVRGPGDVTLVPGPSGAVEMANLSEFERHRLLTAMSDIERRFEVVVLDCGAGISRNVMSCTTSADMVLVVATPEPTAMTDAYAMVKAFCQEQGYPGGSAASLGLIVNLAGSRRDGRQTYDRLAEVAARFLHVPVADYGYVLRDEHVTAAIRERCPVVLRYPRCPASTCLVATAARLSREMGQAPAHGSLFYRVMSMFL